ncbi:N-formylglutamate amidohydrolase [Deinococcus aquatilis]|jgi:N-formylglutamate deformylase|uniref:N-formylglutamate amidohydrolase n=1 Tax=Deinococcus aquatilis TaxID=519440 RepID=UPI00037E6F23|nr:N-formylglutamate amidohydrolase [Deinococcus aquatilis]
MSGPLPELLIVTPHPSGQLPADVLHDMLGADAFDSAKRAAFLRRIFLEGDPFTELIYLVPGAQHVQAPWSRFAVDLNRDRHDTEDNGVLKVMDFDRSPLYPQEFTLTPYARESRLRRLWDSFDAQVQAELAGTRLMIVGHSMAPYGPALSPTPGVPRPGITLMLGSAATPTFPRVQWDALQAVCAEAFAPLLTGEFTRVAIGDPWDTDTLSLNHHRRSGIPAFGIEVNAGLYLRDGEGQDEAIRALNAGFRQFAAGALALV